MSERKYPIMIDLNGLYTAVGSNPYVLIKMLGVLDIKVFEGDTYKKDGANLKKADELKETHDIYFLRDNVEMGWPHAPIEYFAVPKNSDIELSLKYTHMKTSVEEMKPWDEERFTVEFKGMELMIEAFKRPLSIPEHEPVLNDKHYVQWLECDYSRESRASLRYMLCVKDDEVRKCQYPCPDFVSEQDEK